MMLQHTALTTGAFLALLAPCAKLEAQEIDLRTLLLEMIDRSALARLPSPAYTCKQFSSYDRASRSPQDVASWYANSDRSHFLRVEERHGRREYVLMDADGPGAIVRFWSTWHGARGEEFSNGTLRFYLDRESQPAIEGPIQAVLDGGALAAPPLSEGVSPLTEYKHRGHNLYLPIPYGQHCKITYETAAPMDPGAKKGGEALYYQINYRSYARGARVRSFRMEQLRQCGEVLARVQKRLLSSGPNPDARARRIPLEAGEVSAAGGVCSLRLEGPGALQELRLRLRAADREQALRSTVLRIDCDGERTVWCPVGMLFGIDYRFQPHGTWATRVSADGTMSCFWVMPFEKVLSIELRGLVDMPVQIDGEVRLAPWQWDSRSMHFHATWKQLTSVKTCTNAGALAGAFDVNYATVKGRGVFVGDTLSIFNGFKIWWGEGDEKIYVDGETFPSHFGTGTEDYYGYAWGNPNFFASPFHAQPYGRGAQDIDLVVNSRYRALDAIPFERSLRFDMELWHWRRTRVNYSPATFFYARPGATCNIAPDPASAALPVARRREDVVPVVRVAGALEGEKLAILEKSGGETEIQTTDEHGWSGSSQLWWRDGKPGDRLVLGFRIESGGTYRAVIDLSKARDYGIVQVSIDGEGARRFDRYHPAVAHDALELGRFELGAGAHRLEVVIAGSNEKAIARHMFGLDYLKLTPLK